MIEKNKNKSPLFEIPRSMSEQVYQIIRQAILSNEFKPGERLVELHLAETLQASRTPIREAIRRLEHDGLLERLPQGGVRVTPISIESVRQVYGLRGVLEAYAINMASSRITEEDFSALEEMRNRAYELIADESTDDAKKTRALLALNTDFHDTLNLLCGDAYLLRIMDTVRQEVVRMRAMALQNKRNWEEVWAQHDELLRLLRSGEQEKITQFIKQHAMRGADYVMAALEEMDREDTSMTIKEK